MKALSFKIPMTEAVSVRVQEDRMSHFYDRLHFHPEFQFTLIQKGFGNCLVGDQMIEFSEGDVFFLGSNLPHLFKCDKTFYDNPGIGVYAISVFFRKEAFGDTFFQLPELGMIGHLLKRAGRGLVIKGVAQVQLTNYIERMSALEGFARLQILLSMLNICAIAEMEEVAHFNWLEIDAGKDKRLASVLQYIMDHCTETIRLEEVAAVANLSTSAFCRFFKLRTRKTFVRFLNEVRIGIACRMLREGQASISEIAYQVGFQNLSNFNRQFRRVTGRRPSELATLIVLNLFIIQLTRIAWIIHQ